MMLAHRRPLVALLGSLPFVLAHCSSSDPEPTNPSGGQTASAGASATGGSMSPIGGAAVTGGSGTSAAGAASGGAASGGAGSGGAGSGGAGSGGAGSGGAASGGVSSGGVSGALTGGTMSMAGRAGMNAGGTSTGGAGGSGGAAGLSGGSGGSGGGPGGTFTVTSPDHMDNAKFGMAFTCAAMNGMFGSGVNPELNWSGVPDNTKSFAVTFIDTKLGDTSPMGQHWAMWDIPAAVRKLPKGTTAVSGDLTGAKQTNKYLSPCPSGDDTYEFTVYALSTQSLGVTGAEGTGVSNSAGVAKVLTALKALTPLGAAKLHGTSGPMGK